MDASGKEAPDLFLAAAMLHDLWINLLNRNPLEWTVGKAMREVGLVEESKNASLQQRVRLMAKKLHETPNVPPTTFQQSAPVLAVYTNLQSPVSTLSETPSTTLSAAASEKTSYLGGCYRTSKQKHAAWQHDYKEKTKQQQIHKLCTSEVAIAKAKENARTDGGRKKGEAVLRKEFIEHHQITDTRLVPSVRTIQETIQWGTAGKTPPQKGPNGFIQQGDFKQLGEALKAFIALCQSNGNKKGYLELKKLINSVANLLEGKEHPDRHNYTLIE